MEVFVIRAVVLVTVIFGASVQALPVHGGEALYRGTFAATVSSVWGEALLDLGVSENSPLTGTFEIGTPDASCTSGMRMDFALAGTHVSTTHWADPCPESDQFVVHALPDAASDRFMPRGIYMVREDYGPDSHDLGVSWLTFSLPEQMVNRSRSGWLWSWDSSLDGRITGGFDYTREGFDEWGDELVVASGLSFIIDFIGIEYGRVDASVPASSSLLLLMSALWWLRRRLV